MEAGFAPDAEARSRRRTRVVLCGVLLAFAVIAGQLVRLALRGGAEIKITLAEPLARSWSRPDIVDRNGRLLATDVARAFALCRPATDPRSRRDHREARPPSFPASTGPSCASRLPDKSRRFAWVARGLSSAPGAARARSGPAGPCLPHRAQARLSAGRARRAPARHRQHRQQGQAGHRAHARRDRPGGGRAGAGTHAGRRRCACRSTSACSTRWPRN